MLRTIRIRVLPIAALLVGFPLAGHAGLTRHEQAIEALTCSSQASPAEKGQLPSKLFFRGRDVQAIGAYYGEPTADETKKRFRYLSLLGLLAATADRGNDQIQRSEIVLTVSALSSDFGAKDPSPIYRLIRNCAFATLVESYVEQDEPEYAELTALTLARIYKDVPLDLSVEDWPLILATRTLERMPEAQKGLGWLVSALDGRANALRQISPSRASRLHAATAAGLLTLGRQPSAIGAGTLSMQEAPSEEKALAAWRAYPTLFDSFIKEGGAEATYKLSEGFLEQYGEPQIGADVITYIDASMRLGRFREARSQQRTLAGELDGATAQQLAEQVGAHWSAALSALIGQTHLQLPLATLRDRYEQWVERPEQSLDWLATHAPASLEKQLPMYLGTEQKLARTMARDFMADARDQLFSHSKIDYFLRAFSRFHSALPSRRAELVSHTFELAQLRTRSRLTLASFQGELDRAVIPESDKDTIRRFFEASTQSSLWVRAAYLSLKGGDFHAYPNPQTMGEVAFMTTQVVSETEQQLTQFLDYFGRNVPRLAELAIPSVRPLADYQAALASGEMLVATVVSGSRLYVWGVRADQAMFHPVSIDAQALRALVRRLRAGLNVSSAGGRLQVPAFDAEAAYALNQLVFGELESMMAGVDHIIWFGHEELGSVPLSVLLLDAPTKPSMTDATDFRNAVFLGDRYAVTVLPDLSRFVADRGRSPTIRSGGRFLGIAIGGGDAKQNIAYADWARGDTVDNLDLLPKLPDSEEEVRSLASTLGRERARLLLGADASKDRLKREPLSEFSVIAFATHGFRSDQLRGVAFPSLLMSAPAGTSTPDDNARLLQAPEIARLRLNADLVVLSACNTATSDGRPRAEALSGMSQAFFTAGARSLMVTHWSVASDAARRLSTGTVKRSVTDGLVLGKALQQAMIELRRSAPDDNVISHPAFWGPFVIVGDGSVGLSALDAPVAGWRLLLLRIGFFVQEIIGQLRGWLASLGQ